MTLVYSNVKLADLKYLEKKGYFEIAVKSQYETIRLRNDFATLILYSSGKLVVQTKKEFESSVERQLSALEVDVSKEKIEKEVEQHFIGSDEALKGDTFGGLVVAAFYCRNEDAEILENIGVKDSKNLSDDSILKIASKIKERFPSQFYIYELLPKEYNDILSIETLTNVLNDTHELVGSFLKRKFGKQIHVVDEYPGCVVGDIRITKAEARYLAVAAASILARERGLKQFSDLSLKAGFKLPLGSTHVLSALKKIKEEGVEGREFCKVSFKNVQKVFGL